MRGGKLRLAALLVAVVALAACSGLGSPKTATSPSSGSSAAPTMAPLVAVLQKAGPQANTVALVGMNGVRRAEAAFQARGQFYVGNAAPMLQSPAHVGSAGVYYIDGYGVVRLLEPSGRTTIVATFAMEPEQHEVWYAVSPDGKQLIAGVLTAPAVHNTEPLPTLVGSWQFDLEIATAGGATQVLKHVESPNAPYGQGNGLQTIFPVGWTPAGPVAMVGAPVATQNLWVGGPLYLLDAAGQPTQRVGGNDAFGAGILPSGVLLADSADGTAVSVRSADGTVLWKPALDGGNASQLNLAPDGNAASSVGKAVTRSGSFPMPANFYAQGWLDAQTLFGRPYVGETLGRLVYVEQSDPGTPHDLGIDGDFAGIWTGR